MRRRTSRQHAGFPLVQSVKRKGISALDARSYGAAVRYFNACVSILLGSRRTRTREYAYVRYYQGRALYHTGNPVGAAACCLLAFRAWKRTCSPSDAYFLMFLHSVIATLEDMERFDLAERCLRQIVDDQARAYRIHSLYYGGALADLARNLSIQERMREASVFYRQAQNLCSCFKRETPE